MGRSSGERHGPPSLGTQVHHHPSRFEVASPSLEKLINSAQFSGEDIVFLATDINLPGAVDWVMMQSCFGHHFMLILEKQEKYEGHPQFFAVVQIIGSKKQAENFAYR
jgi:hypothetical protein